MKADYKSPRTLLTPQAFALIVDKQLSRNHRYQNRLSSTQSINTLMPTALRMTRSQSLTFCCCSPFPSTSHRLGSRSSPHFDSVYSLLALVAAGDTVNSQERFISFFFKAIYLDIICEINLVLWSFVIQCKHLDSDTNLRQMDACKQQTDQYRSSSIRTLTVKAVSFHILIGLGRVY